jgi:hypothetical protein
MSVLIGTSLFVLTFPVEGLVFLEGLFRLEEVYIWVLDTAVRLPSFNVDAASHTTLPVLLAEAGKLVVDDGGEDT